MAKKKKIEVSNYSKAFGWAPGMQEEEAAPDEDSNAAETADVSDATNGTSNQREFTYEELQAQAALKEMLLPVLRSALRIEVDRGCFVSPNERTVRVMFDGHCVSEATFDVSDRPEYGG